MEVDDAAAADFHGREGAGFDPAAHHVFGDLVEAHHFGQDLLRAERRVSKIGYALGISRKRKPHYTRLFHGLCPIIVKQIQLISALSASYLMPIIGLRHNVPSTICHFLRRFPNDKRANSRYLGI